ncbi:MAG: Pycsar system effector family protein [Salibacteraceae bacterium]
MNESSVLRDRACEHITALFQEKLSDELTYHNLQHTLDTVEHCRTIGQGVGLSAEDQEIVDIAAYFHDSGYIESYRDHETYSKEIAETFLKNEGVPEPQMTQVLDCIEATRMPQNPKHVREQVLCDADLHNLGSPHYDALNDALRKEWKQVLDQNFNNEDWLRTNIFFLGTHRYFTDYARETLAPQRAVNLNALQEQLAELDPSTEVAIVAKEKKKKKKKPKGIDINDLEALSEKDIKFLKRKFIKEQIPERGIETMFRTTSRNHIQLSAIADNKANIMLSINAIIISIVVSSLVPQLEDRQFLLFPTLVLLVVCVLSVVFATLSTRPKVTQGTFTREDIEEKRANLLFFGNFHAVDLDDFEWGMNRVMGDREYLYGSMVRDLYFLGRVLHKKYKYLRICYNTFMIGLVLAILSFAAAFIMS